MVVFVNHSHGAPSNADRIRPRTSILLAEDDKDDAFLIKRALERVAKQSGVILKVTHKTDGLEALAALQGCETPDELPDTIVVDVNMPRMDGITFLHWLRGEPHFKFLHVAVLTTSAELTTRAAALSAGADRFFVKPNHFHEMLTIASEILTDRRFNLSKVPDFRQRSLRHNS
jgi:CheY-like chemotaxis protein